MSSIVLTHADIALWSDPVGSRVVLDVLQVLNQADEYESVGQRFEGDGDATAFRGAGQSRTFQMTARFVAGQHDDAARLLALFRTAHRDDPDGRLQLRSHLGDVEGLDDLEAVRVSGVTRTWGRAGLLDVSWTATTVLFSLEAL